MNDDDLIRLRHMLDAAQEAVQFAHGQTRASLASDRKLALAIIKDVEIVGEAASRVSPECRAAHPQIPRHAIVAMRNRLIHAYFDIDFDQVWGVVVNDLPPLAADLEQILSTAGFGSPPP